jgi:flagellar export protein FliJ
VNGKFRFRLDRVLAVREHEEDRAREGYAERLRLEQQGAERVQAAAERIARAGETQRDAIATARSGAELFAAQAWRERSERARHEAAVELAHLRVELERAREALVAAHRDRRALTMLRERRLDEHKREAARREAALIDDMAGRRSPAVAA